MDQILFVYGSNETITAIMMLYTNGKAMVNLANCETKFADIVARILQGNTFEQYLFIICLDYVLRASIDLIKEILSH